MVWSFVRPSTEARHENRTARHAWLGPSRSRAGPVLVLSGRRPITRPGNPAYICRMAIVAQAGYVVLQA